MRAPECDLCKSRAAGLCPKPDGTGYRCPKCLWAEIDRLRAELTCSLCGTSLEGKGRFACESCIEKEVAALSETKP